MKKSEMMKIVIKDLKDIKNMTEEEQASFILSSLVARGMLPPAIIPRDKNSIWDSEFEWEPEDDQE